VVAIQLSSPYGVPRLTQRRNAASSGSVCGSFTMSTQFAGRGKGHADRTAGGLSSRPRHLKRYRCPYPVSWRCSFQRLTCVLVSCCMNAARSPSRSGQRTKCQWFQSRQYAQTRIGRTRNVSCITRSNAKISSCFPKRSRRPTRRFSTWKTIPPGACLFDRGIHDLYLNLPALSNLLAVTFFSFFSLPTRVGCSLYAAPLRSHSCNSCDSWFPPLSPR